MRTTTRTRTALGAGLVAALLSLTACGGGSSDDESSTSSGSEAQAESSGDVPEVVAEVNGEEIARDDFLVIYEAQLQQATAQAQSGGQAPDEEALQEQVVQNLVDTELLRQEAGERGIDASAEAVDEELAALAEQNQMGTPQELLDALEEQGTSEEQAREQVETQLLVEGLVADEVGEDIEPSEKELRTLYQQVKQQQAQAGQGGQAVPPFDQVRPQLEEQAISQEQGRVAESLLGELTEAADISINL